MVLASEPSSKVLGRTEVLSSLIAHRRSLLLPPAPFDALVCGYSLPETCYDRSRERALRPPKEELDDFSFWGGSSFLPDYGTDHC